LDQGADFEPVYVNHGADWPETYQYLSMFQRWLARRGHRPVTVLTPDVAGHATLAGYCRERRLIPGMVRRWCTNRFKVTPLKRHFEDPCVCHIGVDAGEARRAKPGARKGIVNRFLLIENGLGREGCARVIREHGLPVPEKSGCFFCPFQRKSQWLLLHERHPELFSVAAELEERCAADRVARGKAPIYLTGRPLMESLHRWRGLHPARSRRGRRRHGNEGGEQGWIVG
jgi:3'-phosphoadenosine 5'-phosphosulfate sulfotransferase (PAPS reductase)/FAD synthetase